MKKLVIVDGNNIIHRAYHRFKDMDLKTSKGFPTTAIYGYKNTLRRLLREHDTEYFVVCFDTPEQTHRHLLYPEYKAGREKKHTLRPQYDYIHKITNLMGVQTFKAPGYEADDSINSLVQRFIDSFDEIVIESTDKDLHQLLFPKVKQVTQTEIVDHLRLENKLGIGRRGVRMFISLVGDSPGSGDNIPGCRGIGKVSAKHIANNDPTMELLKQSMTSNLFPIKIKRKILADLANLELSYELVGLVEVPQIMSATDSDLHLLGRQQEELNIIYDELEFKR